MARLILLNGAPGSGKSTLARMYVEHHPMVLDLDIDVLRSMLGGWLEQPREAGLIARSMAIEIARVQLAAGRDVIVPQFLGRIDFVWQLERLCREVDVRFVEVALLSTRQDAVARFVRRSAESPDAAHRAALLLLERSGGLQALPGMYDQLVALVAARPDTHIITTTDGEIGAAYRSLADCVGD